MGKTINNTNTTTTDGVLRKTKWALKDKVSFIKKMQSCRSLRSVADGLGMSFATAQELWKERSNIMRDWDQAVNKVSCKPFVAKPFVDKRFVLKKPAHKVKRLQTTSKNVAPVMTPLRTGKGHVTAVPKGSFRRRPLLKVARQRRSIMDKKIFNKMRRSVVAVKIDPPCHRTPTENPNEPCYYKDLYGRDIPSGRRQFDCPHCDRQFSSRVALVRHIPIHTNERPSMCTQCDLRFADDKELEEHMRSHDGDAYYSCDVCSKRFQHRSNLDSHQLMHIGDARFQCTLCEKSFTEKSVLRIHIRRDHSFCYSEAF